MSFIVRKTAVRLWPITVIQHLVSAAGLVEEVESSFIAHFTPFSESDFDAAIEAADKQFPGPREAGLNEQGQVITPAFSPDIKDILARNALLIPQFICGWGEEVTDESGAPIPFSKDALIGLIQGPDGMSVARAIHRALLEIRYGIAPRKNSLTSPPPGPTAGAGEGQAPTSSTTTVSDSA